MIKKIVTKLSEPVNPTAVGILGIYTIVWGVWVANPFWSVFGQAQLFSALGLIAPEVFWGCFAVFCGSLTIYGVVKESYRSLSVGALVAWAHWFMIAIFYFVGDWQNTGGITSLSISIYAAFIYLNNKINRIRPPKHARLVSK